MLFEPIPEQLSFQWNFQTDKVEERPLCRVMWGKDTSDSRHVVLCYQFENDEALAKARKVIGDLTGYPWFESFKTLHLDRERGGGILSVTHADGPCLQEVLGNLDRREKVRVCLELARAIEVLHNQGMTHGMLDGSNVMYDPVKKVPVICQTVCGFFLHQVVPAAIPPDRRGLEAFAASPKDDVWQFGAMFLKRLVLRDPILAKIIFKCTNPNPVRRPEMEWVVQQLERYYLNQIQPKPSFWIWPIRFSGGLLLCLAVVLSLSKSEPFQTPVPRQLLERGGLTLVQEPALDGTSPTLGETIQDLEVVLGKHIVIDEKLHDRTMPKGGWLVWDQLLNEMGLGWRIGPEGTIEIFEVVP